MVAEIVVYWRGNPTNSLRQRRGVLCVPHPGANPQPGVISGAAEKWSPSFTLKGCGGTSRGQPQYGHQPHNWKRGVSETSRAAAAPEFLHDGHQPKNWPTLDGISMPSDKTSQTSLWNPHRGKVKGEMEV